MNTVLGIVLITFVILALSQFVEGFGSTSPGTMVQLSTSHVPTDDDEHYWKYIYPKQVRKEIYNLTESDYTM